LIVSASVRGSNTVWASHAFSARLNSEKTSFRTGCSIHPTYTLLLAIKILFVNCYCTLLLPVTHVVECPKFVSSLSNSFGFALDFS